MRKAGAISFLLIYLVANTELHQFMRLPAFFAHYLEHKQQNSHISLLEFVVIHYLDTKTPDYKRDQQLPFKNAKCPEVSISIALPPEVLPDTAIPSFSMSPKSVTFESPFIASSFLFTIWQPPRA